jgi:hypothetical protein
MHTIQIAALDLHGAHDTERPRACAPQDLNLSHCRKNGSINNYFKG